MDKSYDAYCIADPDFYETPLHAKSANGADDFEFTGSTIPNGWTRTYNEDWVVLRPDHEQLAAQGWKIHVSATPGNAEDILAAVFKHCLAERITFKFLRGPHVLRARNFKYAPRGSSGKFITIYPAEDALERTLHELDSLIGGQDGPYILSDLRWANGPLYVRYGGFVQRQVVTSDGRIEPAIEDDRGALVPDRREAAFHLPSWLTLPAFLEPHWAARNATTTHELNYRIDSALHFSNGGGIYQGVDLRTDEPVILKEARPFAGLAADGSDAVARLDRERTILRALSDVDTVPMSHDYVVIGEHHFLVQSFVEGNPLHSEVAARYPLNAPSSSPDELAAYTEWAVETCLSTERTVAELHARGVVFGDLHPHNLIINADERACLIDFEVAAFATENFRPSLGDPGFAAPGDRHGFDIDRYALACLRLHVFLPLTALLRRDLGKARALADDIAALFPIDRKFLDEAVDIIDPPRKSGSVVPNTAPDLSMMDWTELRDAISTAINATATPDRTDRLFPGDVEQFQSGGISLAHGAAGVLCALRAVGAPVSDTHVCWLLDRAQQPPAGSGLGLYRGLHGLAHGLDALGQRSAALDLLDRCLAEDWRRLDLSLSDGLAGIGLNALRFGAHTGEPRLREAALDVADLIGQRLGSVDDVPALSGGKNPRAGLYQGSSGCALFLLRLHQHTGDTSYLDAAETALRQDLKRCVRRDNGCVDVDEGWRTMPYLAAGSAGVGLVAEEFLALRPDSDIAETVTGIRATATGRFFVQSGLFNGRAGMLAYLTSALDVDERAEHPAVAEHVRRLSWHAYGFREGVAFAGDQLLRLSTDLATGSAGVLVALGMALAGAPIQLPGLESPPAKTPVAPRNGSVETPKTREEV